MLFALRRFPQNSLEIFAPFVRRVILPVNRDATDYKLIIKSHRVFWRLRPKPGKVKPLLPIYTLLVTFSNIIFDGLTFRTALFKDKNQLNMATNFLVFPSGLRWFIHFATTLPHDQNPDNWDPPHIPFPLKRLNDKQRLRIFSLRPFAGQDTFEMSRNAVILYPKYKTSSVIHQPGQTCTLVISTA